MSITRLQQARQMYAMGQRVGFRGGGMDMGNASNQAQSAAMGGGNNNGGNDNRGPAELGITTRSPTVDMSHFGDTGDIVQADFTPYGERPDTITSFMDNYKAQARSMGLKNAIPGAQIYNLSKTALQTAKAREMLGLGPAVGPGPTDGGDGDGQGIMNLYQPNMLNVAGEVEDETIETDDGEMEDFVHNYRGLNRTRQDKQGQLDPAIMDMLSKLYT